MTWTLRRTLLVSFLIAIAVAIFLSFRHHIWIVTNKSDGTPTSSTVLLEKLRAQKAKLASKHSISGSSSSGHPPSDDHLEGQNVINLATQLKLTNPEPAKPSPKQESLSISRAELSPNQRFKPEGNVKWSEVVARRPTALPFDHSLLKQFAKIKEIGFKTCPMEVEQRLKISALSAEDFKWCQWAQKEGIRLS